MGYVMQWGTLFWIWHKVNGNWDNNMRISQWRESHCRINTSIRRKIEVQKSRTMRVIVRDPSSKLSSPACICDMNHEKTIWNSRNSQSCKSRKVQNILWTKHHAAKCMIQKFSSLIAEKIMKTIIAYRWIIEDAWWWITNCKLMFKYQRGSYIYRCITHVSINPIF